MIREAIRSVVEGKSLSEEEARGAMDEIMEGKATPSQISAFITALRMKGEVVDEITGCAKAMRDKALHLKIDADTVVDTCGTGGDGTNTFNISTAVAFVVAGGGLVVAKHGNRSVSSQCGSADVLKYVGINLDAPPEKVKRCIERIGIGFLFAPIYHPAMKYALPTRREIGIRTIFNILGPLTNPCSANVQLLGVYSQGLTEMFIHVLKSLGAKAASVVHGEDGFDEISITGRTLVSELKDGKMRTYHIQPEDFGMRRATIDDIRGADIDKNAAILMSVLKGEKGPCRDVVLLNSGCVFYLSGKAPDIGRGIRIAEEVIDSGRALKKLEDLIKFINE